MHLLAIQLRFFNLKQSSHIGNEWIRFVVRISRFTLWYPLVILQFSETMNGPSDPGASQQQ
jgi:hypothetical protein